MIPASLAFFTVESRSADSTGFTVSSFLASAFESAFASVLGASVGKAGLVSFLGASVGEAGLATSVVAGVEGFTSSADTFPLVTIAIIARAKITPQVPATFVLRIEP